ncbi:MAG TPA: D-cysteine desulfhydrase family protein [Anaerolineae bacterium]|nr:D-cysteine desulfhydrase family protein [Anaerolineae bacterium]
MNIAWRISAFPRVSLGQFPTPLQPLPHLTQTLAGPTLWIKRDDVVGPALGGNKTRKLEFLFGEAQARRAQIVATFGGLQSNFARQMCAAARALDMQAHCFYFAKRPPQLEGNLLLAQLMGAHLHFIPFGGSGDAAMTLEQSTRLVRGVARLTPACWGRRLYFMPVGGHTAIGCLGYVLAALEIEDQLREQGISQATIVTAAGTGGTLAGLMAGLHLMRSQHTVLGIDVGKLWRAFPHSIAALASEICARLGEPHTFHAEDAPIVERTYVGAGYAQLTPSAAAALRFVARQEGVLLDPVYTAKAMAGLIDLVKQGRWGRDQHVVFLHTGGAPALWAFNAESLMSNL